MRYQDPICPRCGADRQAYYDTMGEPCCVEHGQRLIKGIGAEQYDAWMFLDSMVCNWRKITLSLSPLPHQEMGRN